MAASPSARRSPTGRLQDQIIGLAGTPDDSPQVGAGLALIAQLAADRLAAAEHASVTSRLGSAYVTVAASSSLAAALDQAQYRDDAGPCLEALEAGYPAAVPEIADTMTWPGYRDLAGRLGLRASLSIPLFTGSGRTVASLNLYGRRPSALTTLTAAVWAAYDPGSPQDWNHDVLEPGGRELVAGLIGAVAMRNMIQRAIGLLLSTTDTPTAEGAYLALCLRAAASGDSLTAPAAHLIEQQQQPEPRT